MHAFLWFLLALGIVGCQKKEEVVTPNPPSSLFEAAELEPGTVNTSDAAAVELALNGDGNLKPHGGNSLALTAGMETCMTTLLDALVVEADEANVEVSGTLDVKSCLTDLIPGATVTKGSVKVLFWFGCEDEALADLDGKTFAEIKSTTQTTCQSEGDVAQLINIDFSIGVAGSVTDQGTTTAIEMEARSINATQTAGGDPCSSSHSGAIWTWDDGCKAVSRNIMVKMVAGGQVQTAQGTEDYAALTFTGVTESDDITKPWFVGGSFAAKYNNWNGTVTNKGADTAPTWSMTNGAATLTGTVGTTTQTPTTGSSLQEQTAHLNALAGYIAGMLR